MPRSACCRCSPCATAGTSAASPPPGTPTPAWRRSSCTTAIRAVPASPSAATSSPPATCAPPGTRCATAPARPAVPPVCSRRSAATATPRSTRPAPCGSSTSSWSTWNLPWGGRQPGGRSGRADGEVHGEWRRAVGAQRACRGALHRRGRGLAAGAGAGRAGGGPRQAPGRGRCGGGLWRRQRGDDGGLQGRGHRRRHQRRAPAWRPPRRRQPLPECGAADGARRRTQRAAGAGERRARRGGRRLRNAVGDRAGAARRLAGRRAPDLVARAGRAPCGRLPGRGRPGRGCPPGDGGCCRAHDPLRSLSGAGIGELGDSAAECGYPHGGIRWLRSSCCWRFSWESCSATPWWRTTARALSLASTRRRRTRRKELRSGARELGERITELERDNARLQADLAQRDEALAGREAELAHRDRQLALKDEELAHREQELHRAGTRGAQAAPANPSTPAEVVDEPGAPRTEVLDQAGAARVEVFDQAAAPSAEAADQAAAPPAEAGERAAEAPAGVRDRTPLEPTEALDRNVEAEAVVPDLILSSEATDPVAPLHDEPPWLSEGDGDSTRPLAASDGPADRARAGEEPTRPVA